MFSSILGVLGGNSSTLMQFSMMKIETTNCGNMWKRFENQEKFVAIRENHVDIQGNSSEVRVNSGIGGNSVTVWKC